MKKLTPREQNILFGLIEQLVGANHSELVRRQMHVTTIEIYLDKHRWGFNDLLYQMSIDRKTLLQFVSLVTIHSTSWFRDGQQFTFFEKSILDLVRCGKKHLRVWSTACSTGQEVYSLALVLEKARLIVSDLTYQILGTDIDEISLSKARQAIYGLSELKEIPVEFHQFLLKGDGDYVGYFTVHQNIADSCQFRKLNLAAPNLPNEDFDFIFCRNVLIYFSTNQIRTVINFLTSKLENGGQIYLAMNEVLPEKVIGLSPVAQNIFQRKKRRNQDILDRAVVLVVEDVNVTRIAIRAILEKAQFKVLEAGSAEEASEIVVNQKIDIITLDLNLPGKNGVTWLREVRAKGYLVPVVILSGTSPQDADQVFGAIANGAQEYIEKKNLLTNSKRFVEIVNALASKTTTNFESGEFQNRNSDKDKRVFIEPQVAEVLYETIRPEIIVIGASTGGPEAIWNLLKDMPPTSPPIVIIQHTNSFFSIPLAKTVERICRLPVLGGDDGTLLQPGNIYMAQGDYHLEVIKEKKQLKIKHSLAGPLNGHRPSVDVLFKSVSVLDVQCCTLILSGMGRDGAEGMAALFRRGKSLNFAQSEESCVVYGMPKEAINNGCVHYIGDIPRIRKMLIAIIDRKIVNSEPGKNLRSS